MPPDTNRRRFLGLAAAMGVLPVAGCDQDAVNAEITATLDSAETLTRAAQRLFISRTSLAPEFTEADIAPSFRPNGSVSPREHGYKAFAKNKFADWKLRVEGLVEKPLDLSLADLRAMPARTQITRHDCVEGWSAIGRWTGAPLAPILDLAKPANTAKYVVFHCFDAPDYDSGDDDGSELSSDLKPDLYYESIDLIDARHPQTILAYELNGAPLPVSNGAPLRVRVERQLGYKMAKYIKSVELVADYSKIAGGNGGFWEDRGYEWYAGI